MLLDSSLHCLKFQCSYSHCYPKASPLLRLLLLRIFLLYPRILLSLHKMDPIFYRMGFKPFYNNWPFLLTRMVFPIFSWTAVFLNTALMFFLFIRVWIALSPQFIRLKINIINRTHWNIKERSFSSVTYYHHSHFELVTSPRTVCLCRSKIVMWNNSICCIN